MQCLLVWQVLVPCVLGGMFMHVCGQKQWGGQDFFDSTEWYFQEHQVASERFLLKTWMAWVMSKIPTHFLSPLALSLILLAPKLIITLWWRRDASLDNPGACSSTRTFIVMTRSGALPRPNPLRLVLKCTWVLHCRCRRGRPRRSCRSWR